MKIIILIVAIAAFVVISAKPQFDSLIPSGVPSLPSPGQNAALSGNAQAATTFNDNFKGSGGLVYKKADSAGRPEPGQSAESSSKEFVGLEGSFMKKIELDGSLKGNVTLANKLHV